MNNNENNTSKSKIDEELFGRVVSILDNARVTVVRSVNSNMVLAYWLIGREIVQRVQEGNTRAQYGKHVIENLSAMLNKRYESGFSVASLRHFRQFYQAFLNRLPIRYPMGIELSKPDQQNNSINHNSSPLEKNNLVGDELLPSFNSNLSWSHYRILMRVEDVAARDFYESEAVECGWNKRDLDRQVKSCYYERIVNNRGKEGPGSIDRERSLGTPVSPTQLLKSPYVLEFLGLPDSPKLYENQLEQAIVDNLQKFLLELGKGFSFVARQKHIRFDDEDFYVDLVFYNFVLKCFVLIDLKMGKLTHKDVGQMDGYVRLYEDKFKVEGDNPTVGLILCADKSESVAKYSVLNDGNQIFASKYLQFLPSEEELRVEIERERLTIETTLREASEIYGSSYTNE